VEQVA
jgi:serine/threonine protein kinase